MVERNTVDIHVHISIFLVSMYFKHFITVAFCIEEFVPNICLWSFVDLSACLV